MTDEAATPDGAPGAPPALELLDLTIEAAVDESAVEGLPSTPPPPSRSRIATLAAIVVVAGWLGWLTAGSGSSDGESTPPAGLPGFAELYVAAYLSGSGGSDELRRFYPTAPDAPPDPTDRFVTRVAVLDADPLGSGHWLVRVVADVLTFDDSTWVPEGPEHYLVPIIDARSGLVASALPMRTAPPPVPAVPAVPAGTDIPLDDPVGKVASAFVEGYLGGGDLRPFTAAGSLIAPIDPPPFSSVAIDRLEATETTAGGLLVRVTGVGERTIGAPLAFEHRVVVTEEGGAWKVSDPAAPPLSPTEAEGGSA